MKYRIGLSVIVAAIVMSCSVPRAVAKLEATPTDDAAAVWSFEQEIYRKRGEGDLTYYLSMADPDYTVWAPEWEKPNGYTELVEAVKTLQGTTSGEKIAPEMKLVRVNEAGNVALVYYSTRRTAKAGGMAADDRFDTLHVWSKGKDGWRLLGGMARKNDRMKEK